MNRGIKPLANYHIFSSLNAAVRTRVIRNQRVLSQDVYWILYIAFVAALLVKRGHFGATFSSSSLLPCYLNSVFLSNISDRGRGSWNLIQWPTDYEISFKTSSSLAVSIKILSTFHINPIFLNREALC